MLTDLAAYLTTSSQTARYTRCQLAVNHTMGCTAFKAGDLSVADDEPGEVEKTETWGKSVAGNFDAVRYGLAYYPCNSDQDRYRTPSRSMVRTFLANSLGILVDLLTRVMPITHAPMHPPPAVCRPPSAAT